jgi:hypothetical protein
VQGLADKSRFCTEWVLVTRARRLARSHPATTPSKANLFRAQTVAEAGAEAGGPPAPGHSSATTPQAVKSLRRI